MPRGGRIGEPKRNESFRLDVSIWGPRNWHEADKLAIIIASVRQCPGFGYLCRAINIPFLPLIRWRLGVGLRKWFRLRLKGLR